MNANPDPEQSRRRARRAFIRTHHPDAGGDHADFVTGLAELDAGSRAGPDTEARPGPEGQTQPEAEADQPWPVSLTTTWLRRARGHRRPPRVR